MKIQIIGGSAGKFTLAERQDIAGYCHETFENKNFVDITQ